MTPQEVKEKVRALGGEIKQTTLQNYRTWGLITPPVTKTLGRGKGRQTEYDPIVPGEIYAAQRLMKSDLGFSTAQIRRFRASFCALPNPDAPWPPDMIIQAGALLWGLLRSIANHGLPAAEDLAVHVYAAVEIAAVWEVLRQDLQQRNAPPELMGEAAQFPPEGLLGLIIIRRSDGQAPLAAAMYPGEYKIVYPSKPAEVSEP